MAIYYAYKDIKNMELAASMALITSNELYYTRKQK